MQKHKSPGVINERQGERWALSENDQICFSECDLSGVSPLAIAALQNTFGHAPSWLQRLVSLSTASRLCWQGCSTTKRKEKTQNPSEVLFFVFFSPPSAGGELRFVASTVQRNAEG